MANLNALVAYQGRSGFLKKPSISEFTEQKDASRRQDLVTGIISSSLKSELNATRGGARLFHNENRAQHIWSTGSNNTRVRAFDIGPEAIKSPITSPVPRFPQRASTSGSQRDAGNQNLTFCHILMEDKVSNCNICTCVTNRD